MVIGPVALVIGVAQTFFMRSFMSSFNFLASDAPPTQAALTQFTLIPLVLAALLPALGRRRR